MCHWIRDPARQPEGASPQPPGSRPSLLRPRVVGALATGMVAAVATAAMLLPSNPTAVAEPAPPALQATVAAVPATPVAPHSPAAGRVIEQTATTLDDGVPAGEDEARGSKFGGPCSHEL